MLGLHIERVKFTMPMFQFLILGSRFLNLFYSPHAVITKPRGPP